MAHHEGEEDVDRHLLTSEKLQWLANPVVTEDKIRPINTREYDDLQLQGFEASKKEYDFEHVPRFQKPGKPSNLEVFYDLWFVANLAVFTATHIVNNQTELWSYVSYISLLWFDWFLVSLYDVRYLADSVFERVARALHMGVMVGFAVVSANFTPEEQEKGTFQVTSLVLMVSRLVLAVRYLSIVWHVRHFKQGKKPFFFIVAMNLLAAVIYLGISFRFTNGRNSHAYGTWYAVSAIESLAQLGLSLYFQVLSFDGTHLTERMTMATLFMIGEGINVLGENVVTIVQNNGWTSPTFGNLTAGIAHVFCVYMIYFDWIDRHHVLTGIRQALWTILHLLFHIVLLLSSEGATQFIQWWKILESIFYARDSIVRFTEGVDLDNVPEDQYTQTVVDALAASVNEIWERYAPTYITSQDAAQQTLDEIAKIPNEFWADDTIPNYDEISAKFENDLSTLLVTACNTIFQVYRIDYISSTIDQLPADAPAAEIQNAAFDAVSTRYETAFAFTFVSAGLTLILMVALFVIGRPRHSWSWSVGARMVLFALTGLGLSLITLVIRDEDSNYPVSPWILPTLALVFFVVVVLTHFPRGRPSRAFMFLRRHLPLRAKRARAEEEDAFFGAGNGHGHLQNVHLTSVQTQYEGHQGYSGQPTQIYANPVTYEGQSGPAYGKSS